jgi:hypothetical protein
MRKIIVVLAGAGLLALAGVAWAGKTAHAGNQSLQLKVKVTPPGGRARGATLKIHVDYESTTPGQRVVGANKDIALELADGMRIHPGAAGVCSATAIQNAKGSPSGCPRSSVVGSGTLTADARPTLSTPVPGTITIYNARGKHRDLYFYVHTKFTSFGYFFNIIDQDRDHDGDREEYLDAGFNPPTGPSLFTLKTLDFSIHNSSTHKPFIYNPAECLGSNKWLFRLTLTSYGSEPPITAADGAHCD